MLDIFDEDKCKDMLKKVKTLNKSVEEHCNYQIIVNDVFRRIEEKFDSEHFCDCEKWCKCWVEFKIKLLRER